MEKKPAIRFNGYTDEWKQCNLSEIANKSSEKNADLRYLETFTNSAEKGIISQQDYFDHAISKLESIIGYYVVNDNDFVYNPRISVTAPVGPINRNKLGRSGVMSPLYTVFSLHDIEPAYSEWYFKSAYWHRYMHLNGNTGARHDRFSISDKMFFQMPIPIPSMGEQKLIARHFEQLDELIALHQSNYEKMIATKKSMLDKLFPQGGAKVPAIRFDGFVDEWEKKPLGELFEEYSEKGHEEFPPLTIIQGAGTILRNESDRKLIYNEANLSGYKLVRKGDFIVHLRSFEGGLEIATTTGIISPAYHTLHGENVDSDFYYAYFRSRKFIDVDLRRHVYGIRDGRSIDINGMKTILIPYTSQEEQKQIAGYLNSLDKLIDLYRIRIEKLKNIKAACLQGMFV